MAAACAPSPAAPTPPRPTGLSFSAVERHATVVSARDLVALPDGDPVAVALVFEPFDQLRVYEATGGGRFAETSSATTGTGPLAVTAADLDDDGRLDIVTANTNGRDLTLISRGRARTTSIAVGVDVTDVVAGNLDGRGAPELVLTSGLTAAEARAEVWRFAGGWARSVGPLSIDGASRATIADADGDGDLDVAVLRAVHGRVDRLDGDGSGQLTPAGSAAVCAGPDAGRFADLDGDRRADLVIACRSGGVDVIIGARWPERVHYDGGVKNFDVAAGDLDGDGHTDVATVDTAGHAVVVWMGDGTGALGAPAVFDVGRGPVAIDVVDADGDEDLDVIALPFEERSFEVLVNASREAMR